MKAKRILGLVLTVLMLTAWALPAFAVTAEEAAETGSKMYITTQSSDTVSMRASPGAKYDSVFKVPYGAQVYVYESIVNGADEKWYRVHYYDQNGKTDYQKYKLPFGRCMFICMHVSILMAF